MEPPPENSHSRDAALGLARTRNRLLLRQTVARTRLVVEGHELGDEASEVVGARGNPGCNYPGCNYLDPHAALGVA